MTGTKRIRWEDALDGSSFGYAGTIGPALFKIYAPEDPAGEWLLVSGLPGQEDWRQPGAGPEVLKGKAEEWLSGFAASIGAVFPEAGNGLDGWEKHGRDRDGNLILRYKPSGGLYRVLPEEDL